MIFNKKILKHEIEITKHTVKINFQISFLFQNHIYIYIFSIIGIYIHTYIKSLIPKNDLQILKTWKMFFFFQ